MRFNLKKPDNRHIVIYLYFSKYNRRKFEKREKKTYEKYNLIIKFIFKIYQENIVFMKI